MFLIKGVRQMTAQHFAEKHARQNDVVGKLRLTGALRPRVDLAKRLADDVERFPVVSVLSHSKHRIQPRRNADTRGSQSKPRHGILHSLSAQIRVNPRLIYS